MTVHAKEFKATLDFQSTEALGLINGETASKDEWCDFYALLVRMLLRISLISEV